MTTTRNTKAKQAVAKILAEAHHPMSLAECCAAIIAGGFSINRSSIYRELTRLQKEGLVDAQVSKGVTRFESVQKGEHHHHAVCESCDNIVELDAEPMMKYIEELLLKKGFQTKKHVLEFIGTCPRCTA